MEAQNDIKFDNIDEESKKLIQTKEYNYQIKADTFKLKIDAYSNQTIHFYLKQTNKISIYYYEKNFTYDQILNTLNLSKKINDDIIKVFAFYNMAITKKKVILKEDTKKKQMILNMEKEIDFVMVQCNIEMDQKQIKNEDMIRIMAEEINKINNIQTNNVTSKNDKNDERIYKIEEKLKIIENERKKEKKRRNREN